ncbi:unnamed protein product, partial [Meganyctiphanes norvegica]
TPLMTAARYNGTDAVRTLLLANASTDNKNYQGKTVFDLARQKNFGQIISLLEDPACPLPFVRVWKECLFVNTQEKLTWSAAVNRCPQIRGGQLAEPQNPTAIVAYLEINQY